MLRFLVSDDRIMAAIKQRMPDIVKGLSADDIAPFTVWSFIENTIWIEDIYKNKEVRHALVSSLIKDDTYGNYVSRLGSYNDLIQDPIIQEAIIREMKGFSNPSWFVCAVLDIPKIEENAEVMSTIENLSPLIIKMMDEDEDSDDLVITIAENEKLMKIKDIKEAVIAKVKSTPIPWKIIANLPTDLFFQDYVQDIIRDNLSDLSQAIDEYNDVIDWFMTGIFRSQIVNDSQVIVNVLDRYLEDLIPEIENWWEIWYALSLVTEIPLLFENPQVLDAIGRRSVDFAYSIRLRGDFWNIINVGILFDNVLSNESVIESIIYQLQASYNPWQFLDTEQLDLLLKNKRINEGLKERIPDFVYGITHTTEALFIIEGIQKIEFLRNDVRIIHAVAEFRRSVG